MGNCCWRNVNEPCQTGCIAKPPARLPSLSFFHCFPPTARDRPPSDENKKDEVINGYKFNCFCYSVLKAATRRFNDKNLIGQGGFGDVYKGWIYYCNMSAAKPNDGVAIAVKRLRKGRPQGHYEWANELRFLSRLNHPNIVKLIGYCCEGDHRILVYEYMSKGSLETHLLREADTELNWSRRMKIAIGAAKGLDYLHSAGRPIIHRDLKASNVLLDADFNPKLSDFGLAKFGPYGEKSYISTRVVGTRGYFAPEYIATGHLTLKTDVYSFGVLLLEIFSGTDAVKKFIDRAAGNLVQWAKRHLSNKLELRCVIDEKLERNFRIEEAHGFAGIILRCLNSNPKRRPMMRQVVAALEQLEKNMDSCIQNPSDVLIQILNDGQ